MSTTSNESGKNLHEGGICANSDSVHSHTSVPGALSERERGENGKGVGHGERAIDFKASKMLYKFHSVKVRSLDTLSILWLYLEKFRGFDKGVNLQDLAGWSGFGSKWEKRLNNQLDILIDQGIVERIPYMTGHRYFITDKGFMVLRKWDEYRNEVINAIHKRVILYKIKAETARLKRITRNTRKDSKGRFKSKSQIQGL